MKGTIAKFGLQSLLAMFFLVGGLLLTATRAEAQPTVSGTAGQNWQNEAQALSTLTNKVASLHVNLSNCGCQQGSQTYNDIMARVYFYKNVYALVTDHMPTKDAVAQARTAAMANSAGDAQNQVTYTRQLLLNIVQEASALLQ